ncbi:MAG: IS1 family transposase [Clostridium butyricum]|nr:IS1 family transposase [Clostridium butyricum]
MIKEDINFDRLSIHRNKVLKRNIYENRSFECCPHCNENKYVKYGKYDGIQRYKCKKCNKTFSKTTKALWSYSKKDAVKWFKFMQLTLEKKTLRVCAKELEINLVTAFYWRHKIMQGLTLDGMPDSLEGKIFISKTIHKENFKGCRKGIPKERSNIWIVAARGNSDSMLVTEIGANNWNKMRFDKNVYSKIKENSYIVQNNTDRYIKRIAQVHNKNIVLNARNEHRISNFALNLRIWFESFHGIATKYLKRYFYYFVIFNLYKKFDYIHMIYEMTLKNRFINTTYIRECRCIE